MPRGKKRFITGVPFADVPEAYRDLIRHALGVYLVADWRGMVFLMLECRGDKAMAERSIIDAMEKGRAVFELWPDRRGGMHFALDLTPAGREYGLARLAEEELADTPAQGNA